jgi:hypothetical protein
MSGRSPMRSRTDIEHEMETLVADCRAAAAEHDTLSYDLDHHRLSDLLAEWQSIPLQRTSQ